MCNLIENTNWDLLFSGDNIDCFWTSWHQHFLSIMKESIPNTALRSRRNLPWLNKQLIQAMLRRNKLFKQAKISGDFSKYKAVRNKTLRQLRSAKRSYILRCWILGTLNHFGRWWSSWTKIKTWFQHYLGGKLLLQQVLIKQTCLMNSFALVFSSPDSYVQPTS